MGLHRLHPASVKRGGIGLGVSSDTLPELAKLRAALSQTLSQETEEPDDAIEGSFAIHLHRQHPRDRIFPPTLPGLVGRSPRWAPMVKVHDGTTRFVPLQLGGTPSEEP